MEYITSRRIHVRDGDKYFVYKRYYTNWYIDDNGKCVRNHKDYFDTYFETLKDAERYCNKFNINKQW